MMEKKVNNKNKMLFILLSLFIFLLYFFIMQYLERTNQWIGGSILLIYAPIIAGFVGSLFSKEIKPKIICGLVLVIPLVLVEFILQSLKAQNIFVDLGISILIYASLGLVGIFVNILVFFVIGKLKK